MDEKVQRALNGLESKVGNPPYPLRKPCVKCAETRGRLNPNGNQDCVYCLNGHFQYNAPRTETGREVRTLQTIRGIPVSQRFRIVERAHSRCETCGRDAELTVGHILTVKDGFDFLTDAQINSDENLIAQCAECNSGQGVRTLPLWLLAGILWRRAQ